MISCKMIFTAGCLKVTKIVLIFVQVIFDPSNLIACHDFEYIDLWPDPGSISCYASFNYSESLPSFVSPRGEWHHLAVTWTSANNGLTKIYLDGLLRAETPSRKTSPLRAGGALMLGAEQASERVQLAT